MPKHTHQYIRIKIGKNKRPLMKCAVIGCTHTCKPELAPGRFSICNNCYCEFVLTKANIQLARPHCDNCTVHKTKKSGVDAIRKFLEGVH